MKPNVAATLDTRGFAYLKAGQWDNAISDYDAALQLDPKLASALYGRGIAKRKNGDAQNSKTDTAAALTMDANVRANFTRFGVE